MAAGAAERAREANPCLPAGDHLGGGLHLENNGANTRQANNVFQGNAIEAIPNGQDYAGGGQAIAGDGATTRSDFDRFVDNTVAGQPPASAFESEGGGLSYTGSGSVFHGWLAMIAGNDIGANGQGGGAYAGASAPYSALEFFDSTVAGNSVGAGGAYPGLAGSGDDRLQLTNSIVFNEATPDIGGFALHGDAAGTHGHRYSDACEPDGTAFPGEANICADPLLVDPAGGDIHQTKLSPTIDKGNDELFFAEEEFPVEDFEGDPRPTDGDGDGHTVDMGADESPAGFAVVPPVVVPPTGTTPTPQCSDGRDNDGDLAVDRQDPGCLGAGGAYNAADANEGDESVRDLVLCGRREISLVRADARGGRVVLTGLVAAGSVGATQLRSSRTTPRAGGLR